MKKYEGRRGPNWWPEDDEVSRGKSPELRSNGKRGRVSKNKK